MLDRTSESWKLNNSLKIPRNSASSDFNSVPFGALVRSPKMVLLERTESGGAGTDMDFVSRPAQVAVSFVANGNLQIVPDWSGTNRDVGRERARARADDCAGKS